MVLSDLQKIIADKLANSRVFQSIALRIHERINHITHLDAHSGQSLRADGLSCAESAEPSHLEERAKNGAPSDRDRLYSLIEDLKAYAQHQRDRLGRYLK